MDPLAIISTRHAPQTQRADGTEGERQVPNAAGGFAFQVSEEVRVRRFITLGVDSGTYYASEQKLTKDNAKIILKAARERGSWLVSEIVAISTGGRAPRQSPAIFALAAVSALADDTGRKAALDALPLVCRTGTQLFLFARYVEQFRGWGRGLRRAVGEWYLGKDVDQLAYQAVKYRQRDGWSHRDLLRLSHPKAEGDRAALFDWIVRSTASEIPLIKAFTEAQASTDVATWARLIRAHPLSWEMLPDIALGEADVWRALIEKGMPQTALMRQLPRLTRLGVLRGSLLTTVTAQLTDADRLAKARVHPINVLVAQRTYASGQSPRGAGEWTPVRQVVDALDNAFYRAFKYVEPTGKRMLLALDVSGSMTHPAGRLPISCREASAAVALVTMAIEDDVTCVGFTSTSGRSSRSERGISELSLSPRQRLDDAVRSIANLPFGETDCSLPFTWASKQKREFDSVVVFTDNETYAGSSHPHQALQQYRERMSLDAKLIVVGMTATECSIADPTDPGMLDIAGMDGAVPNVIAEFARGL